MCAETTRTAHRSKPGITEILVCEHGLAGAVFRAEILYYWKPAAISTREWVTECVTGKKNQMFAPLGVDKLNIVSPTGPES
jgi:hypothetical protein